MGASMGSMSCGGPRDESVIERRQQRDREVGQQLLRKIVASADEEEGVDWAALIRKAEELHRKDQEYERRLRRARRTRRRSASASASASASESALSSSSSRRKGGRGGGTRMSVRLQQNLERRRRRRADSTGSFSVNLTTYRNDLEMPLLGKGDDPSTTSAKSYSGSEPTARDECDHSSNGDGSFTLSDGLHTYGSSWEEGLATIHE